MKYLIPLLLLISACGQDGTNGTNGTDGTNGINDSSVLSSWTNTDPTSPVTALDFSQITLNAQVSASTVLYCPIPPDGDASGTDSPQGYHGVTKGNLYMDGSTTYGIVQFGKQPHDHTQTGECYIVGQEAYYYSVSGDVMTLCDITYKVCQVFLK